VISAHLIPVYIGYCAVFKVREEATTLHLTARTTCASSRRRRAVSQNSTACSRPGTERWAHQGRRFQARSTCLDPIATGLVMPGARRRAAGAVSHELLPMARRSGRPQRGGLLERR